MIGRGSIGFVDLDPTLGGLRRCVVVSDPDVVAARRYPLTGRSPISCGRSINGAFCGSSAVYRTPNWPPSIRRLPASPVLDVALDLIATLAQGPLRATSSGYLPRSYVQAARARHTEVGWDTSWATPASTRSWYGGSRPARIGRVRAVATTRSSTHLLALWCCARRHAADAQHPVYANATLCA